MSVAIRRAQPADADGIARVHVQAWSESYRGMVPDAAFDDYPIEKRLTQWRSSLADPQRTAFVLESDGEIMGFASGGPVKWTGLSTDGEVSSLYLLDEAKRRGNGRALLGALFAALKDRGFKSAGLWTLSNNTPARRFYEAMGGRAAQTRQDRRGELVFEDIAYIWDDLASAR